MELIKKLLNKIDGLYYQQEYLCLAKESFQQPLHLYLVANKRIIKDITKHHLFAGYSPLIFTFPSFNEINLSQAKHIGILFCNEVLQPNDFSRQKDAIAMLSLYQLHQKVADNVTIYYYEGIKGKHRFVSSLHQFILQLNNRLFNKKPGNVFLPGNLYTQVQIAYPVPRNISLITVSHGNLYNLFPTDLHGPLNEVYYISSLRHEGKACKQVEESARIVLAQIHADAYKMAYSLGKNYMQELKPKNEFPFGKPVSSIYKLPLPMHVLNYHELELKASFVHGIHKIFLYKILSTVVVSKEPATLAHIHNSFATWRYHHNFKDNYLLV